MGGMMGGGPSPYKLGFQKKPGQFEAMNQFKALWDWFNSEQGYGQNPSGGYATRFGSGLRNPKFLQPQSFKEFSQEYAAPDTAFNPQKNFTNPGKWNGSSWGGAKGYVDPYTNYQFDDSIDPEKVIQSALPRLQEQSDKGFANAAGRFGAAGGGFANTPYAASLGNVQRKSNADLNELTQNTLYDAAKFKAQLKAQMDQAEAERALGAWGTQQGNDLSAWQTQQGNDLAAWGQSGDWDVQGQLAEMQRELEAWGLSGNWKQNAWQTQMDAYNTDKNRWYNEYQQRAAAQDPTETIMALMSMQGNWDQNQIAQQNWQQQLADSRMGRTANYAANNYGDLSPTAGFNRAMQDLRGLGSQFGWDPEYDMYGPLSALMGGR